jgi:adenosylhomocysteine nucleosidase
MSAPIGVMGAMPQEVADLAAAVERPEVVTRAGRRYVCGRLFGREAVVVHSLCGKVAAATTATDLIVHFGVGEIIFTGVAGGVREDLHVGDVVVATELLQHDMNAQPLFPRYEIPLSGRSRHAADPSRRAAAVAAATAFLHGDLAAAAGPHAVHVAGLDRRTPQVIEGVIASGDQFFAAHAEIERLRRELPDVVCVEMEGAAVAQVAHDFGVPLTVIRTISDGGNDDAASDFMESLAAIAAGWSHGILEAMFRAEARPVV